MTTNALFSDIYYMNHRLFTYPQQNYASLNELESFAVADFPPLGDRWKRFFHFQRNPQSLALNERLYGLYTQVQAKKGADFERLKEEVRTHGIEGYLALKTNIEELNTHFAHANEMGFFSRLILKVAQVFGLCLGQPVSYKVIDMGVFAKTMEEVIVGMFPRAGTTPVVAGVSAEEMHQVKLGLIPYYRMTSGGKTFRVEYSKEKGAFTLAFANSDKASDWITDPTRCRRPWNLHRERLEASVVAKEPGKASKPVDFWITFEFWTDVFGHISSCKSDFSGKLVLKPGVEYTIS